jgi:hypothetical protein
MSTKEGLRLTLEGVVVNSGDNNVPLTMTTSILDFYAEDGPSTEVADRLVASFPNLLNVGMSYRLTQKIAEADS